MYEPLVAAFARERGVRVELQLFDNRALQSRLQAAMLAARARVATESESEAIRSSRAPSLDGQAPPPPAPPVLVGSDERAVLLLDTPLPLPAA